MYNYLLDSQYWGGIVENSKSHVYWTMNSDSDRNDVAWGVYCMGNVTHHTVLNYLIGVRAVVEINK